MSTVDAFTRVASRPWLIQEDYLEAILEITQRRGDIETARALARERFEALQAREGEPLRKNSRAWMRGGVAVIPVIGPIFRYANLFTEISAGTSTQKLALDVTAALDNPYINAIALEIDSPGGAVEGIAELGKMIRAARSKKRIVAYSSGMMASAAYWIGSAAHEIVISETAAVGSIGVVMSHLDTRERDAREGIRRVEIVSSQSPDKRMDMESDDGRAKMQAIVDQLADVFVSTVARNRGVSKEKVLADFGRGGVLIGRAAVEAGMADRIGSLEAVIAGLASASRQPRSVVMSEKTGQVTVSSTEDLRLALEAGYTADQIEIMPAASTADLEKVRKEGFEEGRKAATGDAVKAERERILKLQAMAFEGFESELQAAIEAGDSPDKFALALVEAARARGVTLAAMRKDAPPAQQYAPAPGGLAAKDPWETVIAEFGGK